MSQKTNIHSIFRFLSIGFALGLVAFQLTMIRLPQYMNPAWIELSCVLYVLLILLASIGFGAFGILYASIPSMIMTLLIHFKMSHNPLGWVTAFITVAIILFIYMTRFQKESVKKHIILADLEGQWNDYSKEYSKHKGILRSFKAKIDRHSTLTHLGEKLISTLSLEDTAQKTLELSGLLIGKGDQSNLYLLDDTLKSFKLIYQIPTSGKLLENSADVFNHWIMEHRQNLLIEELQSDFRFEGNAREATFSSLIAAALITEDKLIGMLRIESQKPFTFQLEDLRLLAMLASIVSTSLKNSRLYHETLELSLKDGLTGLYVPTYFHQELQKAFVLAQKYHQPLSILMADIDDFKKINDQYGHTVGDTILKKIGETLRQTIDVSYIPTRYGGEEFSAIFPTWDVEKTYKMAEKLINKVHQISFEIRREKLQITLSIGICQNNATHLTQDQLLHQADQALYEAKHAGKNRICIKRF